MPIMRLLRSFKMRNDIRAGICLVFNLFKNLIFGEIKLFFQTSMLVLSVEILYIGLS